jgi:hypothetical protein
MNNPNLNAKWTPQQHAKGEELRALVVANGGVVPPLPKLQVKGFGMDSVGQFFFAGERVPSPVDRDGRLMASWDARDGAGGGMKILHF